MYILRVLITNFIFLICLMLYVSFIINCFNCYFIYISYKIAKCIGSVNMRVQTCACLKYLNKNDTETIFSFNLIGSF